MFTNEKKHMQMWLLGIRRNKKYITYSINSLNTFRIHTSYVLSLVKVIIFVLSLALLACNFLWHIFFWLQFQARIKLSNTVTKLLNDRTYKLLFTYYIIVYWRSKEKKMHWFLIWIPFRHSLFQFLIFGKPISGRTLGNIVVISIAK